MFRKVIEKSSELTPVIFDETITKKLDINERNYLSKL